MPCGAGKAGNFLAVEAPATANSGKSICVLDQ